MKKLTVMILISLLLLNLSGCREIGQLLGIETEPTKTEDLGYLPEYLFEITDFLNLAMTTSDGTQYGPYKVFEIPESILLDQYAVVEEPDLARYDLWMTIAAGNNRAKLTVYDGYRDLLCYQSGETVYYYEDSDGMTLEKLRQDFDSVEFQTEMNVEFVSSGDLGGPLREYADTVYPQLRMGLSEGSRYRYEDYDLMDVTVTEQTEAAVSGAFSYYARGADTAFPENAEPGTGKYEDWYYCTEEVRLELGEDGSWHLVQTEDLELPADE